MQYTLERSSLDLLKVKENFVACKELATESDYLYAIIVYGLIEKFIKLKDTILQNKFISLLEDAIETQNEWDLTSFYHILDLIAQSADENLDDMVPFEDQSGLDDLSQIVKAILCKQDFTPELLAPYTYKCTNIDPLLAISKIFEIEIGVFLVEENFYERLEVFNKTNGPVINVYMHQGDYESKIAIGMLYHRVEMQAYNKRVFFLKQYPFVSVANTAADFKISSFSLDSNYEKRYSILHEVSICQICNETKEKKQMFTELQCCCRICNNCLLKQTDFAAGLCPACTRGLQPFEIDAFNALRCSVADFEGYDPPEVTKNFEADEKLSLAEYNDRLCKICYDKIFTGAFVPCGHIVCNLCSDRLTKCPFCKQKIHSFLKLLI